VATPRYNLTVMLTVGLTERQTDGLPEGWTRNRAQPYYLQVNDVAAADCAAACQHVIDGLAPYLDECAQTGDVDLEIRSIHVRRIDLPLTGSSLAEEPRPDADRPTTTSRRAPGRRGRR
jgi:hypothetical protein